MLFLNDSSLHTIDLDTKPRILVVDDDKGIRTLLVDFLNSQDFEAKAASNASEARMFIASHFFDVIILDVMMPGESGIDLLQELRKTNNTPILLLTACDQLSQKITGLEFGADDYVTKPFEPLELVARVKSLLRRVQPLLKTDVLQVGDYHFTLSTGVLIYRGMSVSLTTTERLLLQILAQRPNEPFSRESLAQKIGHRVSERTVDVQINRLRQKLKNLGATSELIQTIRHLGYAFCLHPSL